MEISIHLMFLFIESDEELCRLFKDFNTSNVFIYPSLSSVLYLFFYISIHLMFLFIPDSDASQVT